MTVLNGNQVYTLLDLQNAITHVLAGSPNANNPAAALINRAINWVATRTSWHFRQRQFALAIVQNANASITRGSDGMTTTVVTVNPHGLYNGAQFQIVGSVTTTQGDVPFNGSYIVQTVVNATTFTIQNAGNANDTASTPGGWIGGQINLPFDFQSLMVIKSAPNSFRDVMYTSLEDLLTRRQFAYGSTYELYVAITYTPQGTAASEPQPQLLMFPTPTQPFINFLQGIYLRRIPALVNATDIPDMPGTFMDLVYHACRAFAKSTEEDQRGEDWQIVNEILPQMIEEDGMAQATPGEMKSTLFPRTFPVSQFYPNGRITA